MNTRDFLDAIKARHNLPSDYALGKLTGWRQSRISQYRTSSREIDDDGCLQIAQLLDMPAPYVMACIAAARAKSAEARSAWEKAATLLKTGTAAAILGVALLLAQNAPSASIAQVSDFSDNLYIMRVTGDLGPGPGAKPSMLFTSTRRMPT
jgi:hypothetical protein